MYVYPVYGSVLVCHTRTSLNSKTHQLSIRKEQLASRKSQVASRIIGNQPALGEEEAGLREGGFALVDMSAWSVGDAVAVEWQGQWYDGIMANVDKGTGQGTGQGEDTTFDIWLPASNDIIRGNSGTSIRGRETLRRGSVVDAKWQGTYYRGRIVLPNEALDEYAVYFFVDSTVANVKAKDIKSVAEKSGASISLNAGTNMNVDNGDSSAAPRSSAKAGKESDDMVSPVEPSATKKRTAKQQQHQKKKKKKKKSAVNDKRGTEETKARHARSSGGAMPKSNAKEVCRVSSAGPVGEYPQCVTVENTYPQDALVMKILEGVTGKLQDGFINNENGEYRDFEDEDISGARWIQGERVEMFIDATGKPSAEFDKLTEPIETELRLKRGSAKTLVKEYIRRRAGHDPRLAGGNWRVGNLSLIVTWDSVTAQDWHIDLLHPNCQGALFLTEGSPATLVSAQQLDGIKDEATLARVMGISQDNPLVQTLLHDPETRQLLHTFGAVLQHREGFKPLQLGVGKPRVGDVQITSGSVVHAGPPCSGFRAVAFFSIWPEGSSIPEYDPDVQYTAITLLGHLAELIWEQPQVQPIEKESLLAILASRVDASHAAQLRHLYAHFGEDSFVRRFVEAIEDNLGQNGGRWRKRLIQKMLKSA